MFEINNENPQESFDVVLAQFLLVRLNENNQGYIKNPNTIKDERIV